jgi:hypothetical protein
MKEALDVNTLSQTTAADAIKSRGTSYLYPVI